MNEKSINLPDEVGITTGKSPMCVAWVMWPFASPKISLQGLVLVSSLQSRTFEAVAPESGVSKMAGTLSWAAHLAIELSLTFEVELLTRIGLVSTTGATRVRL